jgi:hypothetical protein
MLKACRLFTPYWLLPIWIKTNTLGVSVGKREFKEQKPTVNVWFATGGLVGTGIISTFSADAQIGVCAFGAVWRGDDWDEQT